MKQEDWLKYGALALGVVGFVLLFLLAFSSGGDLEGRTWVVEQMSVEGSAVTPIEGTAITANFEDGTVAGIASCNNYFAGYETDGSTITVGPAGATLMFCGEPAGVMDQEQVYLSLLHAADTFDVDGDTLTLSAGDTVVITYNEAVAEQQNA
jgi:heat shock protein HslJ